jgi:tripeptide aminopeptidase
MTDISRLKAIFAELVAIDSPVYGERRLCDRLKEKLRALGASPREDDALSGVGGSCGNIYAYFEGDSALPPLLLCAHMDTVEPSRGKKAVFHPDGRITSDGTTVLGADDVSGITAILGALTAMKESGAAHRPVEVIFDAAEEIYCAGISRFDFSRLRSKEAYVFDLSGPVGRAAYQAPSILSFCARFRGRAAHAAFSPENGIHAVKAAADAVSRIECGRIGGATVNVGTIHGGSADNVVPDECTVTGEVRSFSDAEARRRVGMIKDIAAEAAEKYGAATDFTQKTLCTAWRTDENSQVAARFKKACLSCGLEGGLVRTYGGSDNNYLALHGVEGLVVAAGMNDCHSCREYSHLSELERAARLTLALIMQEE